jgi:hypothetical protein
MLLRHTASALALAATLALNGANAAPRLAVGGTGPTPTPTPTSEIGGGSSGLTCLGCVAAGVITLASSGWLGVWTMFMVGGTTAVTAGTAVVTCTAACTKYLREK